MKYLMKRYANMYGTFLLSAHSIVSNAVITAKAVLLSVCPQQILIFCNCPWSTLLDSQNDFPLARRFQRAIICHQRTRIGKAIEV